MRTAPDGGTAAIGRDEFDDGMAVCPGCGEEISQNDISVEAFEVFGSLLCDQCFESGCEALEDEI